MDITTISQLIGTLGFPIIACLALGYYVVKIQKQNNDTILKLCDTINNNTLALTEIKTRLGKVVE